MRHNHHTRLSIPASSLSILIILVISIVAALSTHVSAATVAAPVESIRSHFIHGTDSRSLFDKARAQRVAIVFLQHLQHSRDTAVDSLKDEWIEHFGGASVMDVSCNSGKQCMQKIESDSAEWVHAAWGNYPQLGIYRIRVQEEEGAKDLVEAVQTLKNDHTEYHVLHQSDSNDITANDDSAPYLPTDAEIADWQIMVWTSVLLTVTIAAALYVVMSIDYSKDTAHYAADVMD